MSGRSSRSGPDTGASEPAATAGARPGAASDGRAWRRRRRGGRSLEWALGGLLALLVPLAIGYVLAADYVTGFDRDCARAPARADAAIVLGAAVWPGGRPSPVLAERTRAAGALYRAGRVHWIATTGGLGRNPPAEGVAARELLVREGWVEDPARVIVEDRSRTTFENLANVRPALRARGVQTVYVVSDGFHLARGVLMARDLGLRAWGVASDGSVYGSIARHPERRSEEGRLVMLYWFTRPWVR